MNLNKLFCGFITCISLSLISSACELPHNNYSYEKMKNGINIDKATDIMKSFFETFYINYDQVCTDPQSELITIDLSRYKVDNLRRRNFSSFNLLTYDHPERVSYSRLDITNWWILIEPPLSEDFLLRLKELSILNNFCKLMDETDLNLAPEFDSFFSQIINGKWIFVSELENVIKIENMSNKCMNMYMVKNLFEDQIMLLGFYEIPK